MKIHVLSARPLIASALVHQLRSDGNAAVQLAPCPDRGQLGRHASRLGRDEIILLDLVRLPGGLEVVAAISAHTSALLVVLVGTVSDLLAEKLRIGGADAVLSEGDDPRALPELLGRVRQGGFRRSESFAQAVHFAPLLTTRQREVLDLVVAGHSDAQIASRLEISLTTAETHRRDVQGKLGVHSHHELILHAVRHGYVDATHIAVSRPERQASRSRTAAT